jgi:hypothetical protein
MIVLSENKTPLISLTPVYDWFKNKGYRFDKEHILIEGVPVQFIPAYNELVEEAVKNSLEKQFGNSTVKVISPEYLISIMVDTFRQKDKERIIRFREQAEINYKLLNKILLKFDLLDKYKSLLN